MRNHPGKLAIACTGTALFIFGGMMTFPATNIEYVHGVKCIILLCAGSLYFFKKWADNPYYPFFEEQRAPLHTPIHATVLQI